MLLLFFPEANATSSKFYLTCVYLTLWEAVPVANHKAIHTPPLISIYTHLTKSQKNFCCKAFCRWPGKTLFSKQGNFKVGGVLLMIVSRLVFTPPGMEIPPPFRASVPMPWITTLTVKGFFPYLAETFLAATCGHCLQPFCCTPQRRAGLLSLQSSTRQSKTTISFPLSLLLSRMSSSWYNYLPQPAHYTLAL